MKHAAWKCSLLLVFALSPVSLLARQTTPPSATPASTAASTSSNTAAEISNAANEKLAQLEQRVAAAQSSADNAWMLVSAALVLMMTGPGLALFYGGLVRRKNTLAIMMQSFALMALITVLWALVGYSLCFGGNGPVIGGFEHAFLCGVGAGLINVIVKVILDPHLDGTARLPTIGASGAIYGVLLAVAVVMPERQVWVFPLPVTVSMRIFVAVMGAIEFFGTIGASGDNVSHVCHLGGMLVGYIYLRRGSYLYGFRNTVSDWQRRRLKKKFEVYVRENKEKPPSNPDSWVN